jgi:hypothetical protein
MIKTLKYASVIASLAALAAVIVMGIKLADNNYDIIFESIITGASLAVLFITAIYRIVKQHQQ